MFFKSFTPLFSSSDTIRAARIYPGGENLDRLFGEKLQKEEGWYYPEAWLFSPEPAINPGSRRGDEGQTLICDRQGREYSWKEYLARRGEEVLGKGRLNITVKLLDGSCTLPKEFHFRAEDEPKLRSLAGFAGFNKTLIKPEVWIRHPDAEIGAGRSFVGFRQPITREEFGALVEQGVEAVESSMNSLVIPPGEGLYIPGGIVHSLGPGLYFEILADGDLKITLEDRFAGRVLPMEERLVLLFEGPESTIDDALGYIDYSLWGEKLMERTLCRPKASDASGGGQKLIVETPWFGARWLSVPPGGTVIVREDSPHVLICVQGSGRLSAPGCDLRLESRPTTFKEFSETGGCYAGIVHGETEAYSIENTKTEPMRLLAAFGT